MELIPNGRIWIDTPDGAFLGYGRIELLLKIEELGSLRQAALQMKMSYQQAWKLVSEMNARAGTPLVLMNRGGKNGGTATLTPQAKTLIQKFTKFNATFQEFLKSLEL